LLAESTAVPGLLRATLAAACDEIEGLEAHMRAAEQQLGIVAADMPDVPLLRTVPGIGLITATALVARVTDIRRFRSGRHFANYVGLTPREDSTGSRRRLGAIGKQGDVYVRMLLTHGARSILWHAKTAKAPTTLQRWALQTEQRRGHNVAAVAVANKLARIVWAVWAHGRPFAVDDSVA
jgi:transposase